MTEQNKKLAELMKHIGVVDEKVLQEKLKKAYYEGEPLITDAEYDELFPNDYVGYTVEQNGPWEVLEHKIEMGSLDKLKTWDEVQNWLKDKGNVVWEPKLDGLSMEAVYENGILTHAILRGGGDKGEDILKNARNFIGVLPTLQNAPSYVSVRGEVIISQTNFDKLCQMSNEAYSNRRNCVPGICRRYDGQYSNLLGFYTYDIYEEHNGVKKEYSSELEKLSTLFTYKFMVPFAYNVMTEKDYMSYGDIRDTAESFQMDGLVIKTFDMKHQIALKFEPKGEKTTVTGYQWEVGVTGKLAPKILFETVNIGGSNLSQASGGSLRVLEELNAPVGSIVEVRKMNDVIPKVTHVVERLNGAKFEPPTVCPICGQPLERQGTDLYCVNKTCPVKIKNKCCAVYWAIAIKGITSGFIEKRVEYGQIAHPHQVLEITPEQIVQTGGYSLERAKWVVEETHKKWKEIIEQDLLLHLLWMLPIPTVSNAAYEKIADNFKTIDDFYLYLTSQDVEIEKSYWINILGNAKGIKTQEYLIENREDIVKLIEGMRAL